MLVKASLAICMHEYMYAHEFMHQLGIIDFGPPLWGVNKCPCVSQNYLPTLLHMIINE